MRFGSGKDDETKELQRQVGELQDAVRTLVHLLIDHHAFGYRHFTSGQGDFIKALQPFAPESPLAYAQRQIASKG